MKTYKLPKILKLDVKTWKCGGEDDNFSISKKNRNGKGDTSLLNGRNYRCCLGQFCQQAGVPDDKIFGIGFVYSADIKVSGLTIIEDGDFIDTKLANDCIAINDDVETTVKQKIELLRKRLKKSGYTLKVFNKSILKGGK